MSGIGVISLITVIFNPVEPNALIADSLPLPGPLITISICFMPFSIAFFPASSAASCAAKGVDFLEPLNPLLPDDDHEIVLPEVSVMVTIVLLKVEFICAIPDGMFFLTFFYDFVLFVAIRIKLLSSYQRLVLLSLF